MDRTRGCDDARLADAARSHAAACRATQALSRSGSGCAVARRPPAGGTADRCRAQGTWPASRAPPGSRSTWGCPGRRMSLRTAVPASRPRRPAAAAAAATSTETDQPARQHRRHCCERGRGGEHHRAWGRGRTRPFASTAGSWARGHGSGLRTNLDDDAGEEAGGHRPCQARGRSTGPWASGGGQWRRGRSAAPPARRARGMNSCALDPTQRIEIARHQGHLEPGRRASERWAPGAEPQH